MAIGRSPGRRAAELARRKAEVREAATLAGLIVIDLDDREALERAGGIGLLMHAAHFTPEPVPPCWTDDQQARDEHWAKLARHIILAASRGQAE